MQNLATEEKSYVHSVFAQKIANPFYLPHMLQMELKIPEKHVTVVHDSIVESQYKKFICDLTYMHCNDFLKNEEAEQVTKILTSFPQAPYLLFFAMLSRKSITPSQRMQKLYGFLNEISEKPNSVSDNLAILQTLTSVLNQTEIEQTLQQTSQLITILEKAESRSQNNEEYYRKLNENLKEAVVDDNIVRMYQLKTLAESHHQYPETRNLVKFLLPIMLTKTALSVETTEILDQLNLRQVTLYFFSLESYLSKNIEKINNIPTSTSIHIGQLAAFYFYCKTYNFDWADSFFDWHENFNTQEIMQYIISQ